MLHLAPRGWVDDICRLDKQIQRIVLSIKPEEEDGYNHPSVRTGLLGRGANETHTQTEYANRTDVKRQKT